MKILVTRLFLYLFFITTIGCNNKTDNKIATVHWDRDMCARCVMVVSDRHNTVQVRNPKTRKVYMFDDIGCMILWFKENKIIWKDDAKIWITDIDTSKWIDARTAYYDTLNITPMAYGFSAHKKKDSIKKNQEIIDFQEVSKRVLKIGK